MKDTKKLEILIAARGHIARGWTQGRWATNVWGNRVSVLNPTAARFCAVGAVKRACGLSWWREQQVLSELRRHLPSGHRSVMSFNDHFLPPSGKFRVLALFDRAIEALTPPAPDDANIGEPQKWRRYEEVEPGETAPARTEPDPEETVQVPAEQPEEVPVGV